MKIKHLRQRFATALLALSMLSAPAVRAQTDQRIVVKTQDDLPRHTYNITGKSLALLQDEKRFNALLDRAVADTLGDLQKYQIEDPSTLRAYYDFLQMAFQLQGDFNQALAYTEKARALETKEEEKLMRGVSLRSRMAARQVAGTEQGPRFDAAYKAELRRQVSQLPFESVKDRLIMIRNSANIVSRPLVESSLATQVDPIIEANHGQVPQQVLGGLVSTKLTLDFGLRVLPLMAEVYGEIIDANAGRQAPADLWTPRLVRLKSYEKATPVVVGIWDSGVDTSLYPRQLWTNPKERLNGRDNDGNGFVGDVHGIAFGEDHRPTVGPLCSLAGLKGDKDQLMGFVVASQDMQAGIQNAGVEAFQKYYKSLQGEQLRQFTDDINLIGSYIHGTHVAGVAVAGNPFARILHVTENWPYKAIPDHAPTVAEGALWGEETKQAVAYLKQANVRVVNLSWRIGRSAFEGMLESKGVGGTAAERAELSRKIFAGLRDGLEQAIRSAPDILFIAGSGNEDNDVDFAEYVPAGLRLPNLITVGAVDDQDKFTSFTTTGKNVELYANGYRVESCLPGGQLVKLSGTSMAAPQVTNLAAKILALRPDLKPAEVVDLIRQHADPVAGQPGRFVINPKKTIAAIRPQAEVSANR